MPKPVEVKAIDHMMLFVKYSDGLEGVISLLHQIKNPVYKDLLNMKYFSSVTIDENTKDICWDNGVYLCKDAIYKQLDLVRLAKSLKLDLKKF